MKAMIFDMDGVLVNTEPLHYECWKAALADEGVDMSYEVYKPCIGSTVGYLMKLLKEAYGETVSDAGRFGHGCMRRKKRSCRRMDFHRFQV